MNEDKSVLKLASKNYRAILEKILRLETPKEEGEDNEVIKFRREFFPSLSGFKFDPKQGYLEKKQWFQELAQNKGNFERYQQRLRDVAARFGFDTPEELRMLEEYLQTGDPIVHGSLSNPKVEVDKWQPTRVWDTAPLARRLKQMRKAGMSYREIAGYYNKIKPANAPTVTTTKLRQIISRAGKQLIKPQS